MSEFREYPSGSLYLCGFQRVKSNIRSSVHYIFMSKSFTTFSSIPYFVDIQQVTRALQERCSKPGCQYTRELMVLASNILKFRRFSPNFAMQGTSNAPTAVFQTEQLMLTCVSMTWGAFAARKCLGFDVLSYCDGGECRDHACVGMTEPTSRRS